jgi:hypothetical protein
VTLSHPPSSISGISTLQRGPACRLLQIVPSEHLLSFCIMDLQIQVLQDPNPLPRRGYRWCEVLLPLLIKLHDKPRQHSISTLPSGPPTRQGCRLPSSDAALLFSLKNVCACPWRCDTLLQIKILSQVTKSTLSPLNRQNLLLGQRAEQNPLLCQLQVCYRRFWPTTKLLA